MGGFPAETIELWNSVLGSQVGGLVTSLRWYPAQASLIPSQSSSLAWGH